MANGRLVLLESAASLITTRDYTSHDAYLDDTPLNFYAGQDAAKRTDTIQLAPPQTDVRNNPNEMPSALGRFFAQGDFSHGAGQPYFHYDSSDQAKFLHSEGFDISEPGLLRHLSAVLTADGGALTAGSSGRSAQSQGQLFVADGNEIRVYDPITGTVATEDPHDGEAATAVRDLVAEGDQVYAALGTNGIHVRDAAGTWSHYSDAQAILVSFLKDRLIAASARNFYEITGSGAAPAAKLTLKEGWTFTDLGENGPYIYAPAIDEDSGLSKVHHFGLDNSLNVAVQGSTWLPNNELCYSFKGYLGIVFLGCGRVNDSGGKDALVYRAEPDADGFLSISLVQESEGAGSRDLATRGFATKGRSVLFGWTLGSSSPYGVREGLAKYDPALASFVTHLSSSTDTATPDPILSCGVFEGRVYFVTIDGVYYEDTSKRVASAYLITSVATFQTPQLKNWDESEVSTKALPATSSVAVQYSLDHPEEGIWSLAGTHQTTDETVATFRHANTESARLAVKLVSTSTSGQTNAPEIEGFSVRMNPTVESIEYRLLRTIRLSGVIAKGMRGEKKHYNPRAVRDELRGAMFSWFDWHEVDASYNVRLVQMSEIKSTVNYSQTNGDPRKEEYIVTVVLEGREA